MRALFLVPWPAEAASTRLRAEQYFPYLRRAGIQPTIRPFMTPELYRIVYGPGNTMRKMSLVAQSAARRVSDVLTAARADVVFIHREAFPFGSTLIERTIEAMGVPIVLDFDDAIYLTTESPSSGFIQHLKRPDKVRSIVSMSQSVIVGNNYLKDYAQQFNPHVVTIPTPVDTDVYYPRRSKPDDGRVTIGWIGSGTTSRYLDTLRSPLARLLEKHQNLHLSIVGGRAFALEKLPRVEHRRWSLADELKELHTFDIGLMPYPDNQWARGKCAFKALLYMSVGIPGVCSAVGMAEEIITGGENGYLARSEDDWYEVLDALISDPALRQRVGDCGRDTVTQQFSLETHAPRLQRVLEAAATGEPIQSRGQAVFPRRPAEEFS